MIASISPGKVLYVVKVMYSTPGFPAVLIDNVTSFGYDENPDRLVVHHDSDQRTDVMTEGVRLIHITVQ